MFDIEARSPVTIDIKITNFTFSVFINVLRKFYSRGTSHSLKVFFRITMKVINFRDCDTKLVLQLSEGKLFGFLKA